MNILLGLVLLAVAGAMLWFGRPAKGADLAPFLRSALMAQLYAMTVLIGFVLGVSFLLMKWPA